MTEDRAIRMRLEMELRICRLANAFSAQFRTLAAESRDKARMIEADLPNWVEGEFGDGI